MSNDLKGIFLAAVILLCAAIVAQGGPMTLVGLVGFALGFHRCLELFARDST